MQLLQSDELDVVAGKTLSKNEVPHVEIILNGAPTRYEVSGVVLEAAFNVKNQYLLFLTDDVLHEDMLSIHLLDDNLILLDSVTIGSIYATGSFADLEIVGDSELKFSFIDDKSWHLHTLPGGEFVFPFLSEPKGVWRRFGFKRYFRIESFPLPVETSELPDARDE